MHTKLAIGSIFLGLILLSGAPCFAAPAIDSRLHCRSESAVFELLEEYSFGGDGYQLLGGSVELAGNLRTDSIDDIKPNRSGGQGTATIFRAIVGSQEVTLMVPERTYLSFDHQDSGSARISVNGFEAEPAVCSTAQ